MQRLVSIKDAAVYTGLSPLIYTMVSQGEGLMGAETLAK